ncbi:CHAD domain-containing protein [endosymbiont of Ridgeia piscesae]|jgi:CHAD domain-containing protein|uniref:CHAD domain-containing protein n=1 Tax=endosymbiont of Ridgeia piscesae TaxID=54398 RepID=A0A0T5YWL4_9GAMM|nr:CHAD domain-containing protein [endosymbiont of Ridgeia piscesae]KRT54622.1 CHAD domain (function unknown) [endosymbiont of Ridgeia piscesae]KRT57773.1 CHAD domain-containing protein [endosymbiont of Ridgeia piscesae]
MVGHPIQYALPQEMDLEMLRRELERSFRFFDAGRCQQSLEYLESFDWRIWQVDSELLLQDDGACKRLWCFDRNNDDISGGVEVAGAPVFAADLPADEAFEPLRRALAMRALLPIVKVEREMQHLRLLNREEKTVLRLALVSERFRSVQPRQEGDLGHSVMLSPVRGYDKYLSRVENLLSELGLETSPLSRFLPALEGIGRRPMDYSSKLNYQLDPAQEADSATRQILLGLLDTIEANVDGTRADIDSEFLHDLRVAVRRTRSALSQIKGVFDPEVLEPFKNGFAWVGQITGETRDLDVYLLKFSGYRQSLPALLRNDLDPFHSYLLERQKQAQKAMVRKLNSPHFRTLLKDWRAWLEMPLAASLQGPMASQPIPEVANQRIRKIYRRVLKDGLAITEQSEPEALHDLRKQCKKLRYLMEFFRSLYPNAEIKHLIKALKILLDNLGDFQDLQVQAESLEQMGQQMLKEGASAATLMAMGILVGDLLQRQQSQREQFAALFADFSSQANQSAFAQLLKG